MTGAMTWLGRIFLGVALAGAGVLVPGTAWAITVECSNEDGSCSVSNDGGVDFESCECVGGAGTGGTGGSNYSGLNAAELDAICQDLLEFCTAFDTELGTDTAMTSVGTVSSADTSDSATTTDPATSDVSDSASTTDHSTSDPTDSATASGSTSDEPPGSTGDDTEGTTGDGTTGDGTTSDGSTSNVQPTATDPTTGPIDQDDSSGGEGGADSEQSGCGCTAGPGDPVAALGLFALLGLRRRRD